MKATIKINMDNAAFEDNANGAFELAEILKDLVADLQGRDYKSFKAGSKISLRDTNGNPVGELKTSK